MPNGTSRRASLRKDLFRYLGMRARRPLRSSRRRWSAEIAQLYEEFPSRQVTTRKRVDDAVKAGNGVPIPARYSQRIKEN